MSRVLPILFNTEMVQEILEGRKTVTRRVAFPADCLRPFEAKEYPDGWWYRGRVYRDWDMAMKSVQGVMSLCKYKPKDILYVRETWTPYCINKEHCSNILLGHGDFCYKATKESDCMDDLVCKWHPSIHMPKEAARIWLKVTGVRVERLQEINEAGAGKEGFVNDICLRDGTGKSAAKHFAELWDSTIKKADIGKYGWDANPWVWVIEFERCEKPEEG